MSEETPAPAGFAIEDDDRSALPADVIAGIHATAWDKVVPGKVVPIPVNHGRTYKGGKSSTPDQQARSNVAYDVLEVVRAAHPAPDGYKWGTARNSGGEDGTAPVTVRVILRSA